MTTKQALSSRTLYLVHQTTRALALALVFGSTSALADTITITNGWTSPDRTYAPPISRGTMTSFPTYSNSFSWNYGLYTFQVSQSGDYSVTVTTSPVVNTSWLLEGTFAPTPVFPPSTPLSNFLVGNFSGYIANIPPTRLEAGKTYSLLIAFNNGGSPADTSTFSISGPGCAVVSGFATPCATRSIPTMSSQFLIGTTVLLGAFGLAATRRRKRVQQALS